jgi:hypothetical protein
MVITMDVGWDHCRCIVGYRPAKAGAKNWADEDEWIGPFFTPDKDLICGLEPSGATELLLSTHGHVLLLDPEKLIDQAQKSRQVRSTSQWRKDFQARTAKGTWQTVLPLTIINRQYDEARQMLDKRLAELGSGGSASEEGLRLLLWRARLLADQKDGLDESIKLYDQAATHQRAGAPGEVFARVNQMVLLHRAGRWQEMLDLAQRIQTKFPQTVATNDIMGMGWYVADARKHLSAKSQPATIPARDSDAPASGPSRPKGAEAR